MAAEKPRVVIIGAGAAGLCAAVDLKDQADVVIVEARNRVGGRAWTVKFADGAWVDLGAAFIDGTGPDNPVMQEFKRNGFEASPKFADEVNSGSMAIWGTSGVAGDRLGQASQLGVTSMFGAGIAFARMHSLYGKDIAARTEESGAFEGPDEDFWTGLRKLKSGGCFGFGGFDSLNETTQAQVTTMFRGLTDATCVPQDALSYRWWQEEEIYGGPKQRWGGKDLMPVGGFQQLCEKLAEGLDVRFESIVSAVRAVGDGVVVELSSGEKIPCAACICTLPHGVLKAGSVVFEPALPAPKLDAIAKMVSGYFNRVAIRFDKCFWETRGTLPFSGRVMTNLRMAMEEGRLDADSLQPSMVMDCFPMTNSNILIFFWGPLVAEKLEKMTDEEVIEQALKVLETQYPKTAVRSAKVLEYYLSKWGCDPYACGTYASIPVGTNGEVRDQLAAPHGKVFFAGEATIKGICQTVAGAMLSGRRAAKEAGDHLKQLKLESDDTTAAAPPVQTTPAQV